MINEKLKLFVTGLLNSNSIVISKKTDQDILINQLVIYIDALIFNIISIGCIISIINNSNSITKETLPIIKLYIEDKCEFKYKKSKKIMGGAFNTAAFYGANESMYKVENQGSDILGIKWSEGIIRPTIGQAGGGYGNKYKNSSYNYIKSHVLNVLQYHNISAPKSILDELIKLIDHHIKCLIMNMKKCKKELTLNCIEKIIMKNKILTPFK